MWDEIIRLAREVYQKRDAGGFAIMPEDQLNEGVIWNASRKYYEYLLELAEGCGLFTRGNLLRSLVLADDRKKMSDAGSDIFILLKKFGIDIPKNIGDFMEK